jgi:tRNA(His) 5'-end guanylyltransferase
MLQYQDIHSIHFLTTAVLLYTNSAVSGYPHYPLPHYSSATLYKCRSIRLSAVSTSSLQQCYCIQMLQYKDIHSIRFFTTAVILYTNDAVSGYPQYPLPHYSSATLYKGCSIRISTVPTSSLQP